MMYISFDKTFKDEKKTISSTYLYIYNFKISLKFSFFFQIYIITAKVVKFLYILYLVLFTDEILYQYDIFVILNKLTLLYTAVLWILA